MTGHDVPGPRVLDAESYLFPDSIDAMGFVLKETGLHIVLSRDVPDMIRGRIRDLVHCFLERNRAAPGDVAAFVLHPGGRKLLAAIEDELALPRDRTQPSWDVLAEYGNLSSASVLFVLDAVAVEKAARRRQPRPDGGLRARVHGGAAPAPMGLKGA